MIDRLSNPTQEELDALTELWEASVRATHHFLAPEDIPIFKLMLRAGGLEAVDLYVIRAPKVTPLTNECFPKAEQVSKTGPHESTLPDRTQEQAQLETCSKSPNKTSYGGFSAFAGVECDKLEMLFVAPAMRGCGLGREMVEYLIRYQSIKRVDVNEQNQQAVGFYERMGFRIVTRDAVDPSGKPYPTLHMELKPQISLSERNVPE